MKIIEEKIINSIRSRDTLIFIETVEEREALNALQRAAFRLEQSAILWNPVEMFKDITLDNGVPIMQPLQSIVDLQSMLGEIREYAGDAIFILQDVTEQKRMEKELVESHKTSVMSQIASGVAHEVRNPLHAIQAISEAMALDLDENPDYKDYLMHIKAQVGRLSHLMNDLLDLGKPIKSSQFSRASLTEIVTAAVGYLREGQAERLQQIKIVNRLSSDNMVLVDTNKIQQVIINLVDNAIQHSPRDGEILLEIGKADKNFMMIKVIDRGDGLKSEDQHRIFEPFYTTRKSGTGLGMSLCKHIIDSHGGSIDITNNQNAPGCTAQFTIPVYKSKEYE